MRGPFKGHFPRVEKFGETTAVREQNGGIRRSGVKMEQGNGGTRRPVSTAEQMGEKTEKQQGLIARVGC